MEKIQDLKTYQEKEKKQSLIADKLIDVLYDHNLSYGNGKRVLEKALSKLERASQKNSINLDHR